MKTIRFCHIIFRPDPLVIPLQLGQLNRFAWLFFQAMDNAPLLPIRVDILFWKIAKVTDDSGNKWVEEFRKFMFKTSKRDYPFLRMHLFGNYWLLR